MPLHDVIRQRAQPFTAALTSNRIFLYSVFSTFAVAATIANACREHSNFYSVAIYLSNSSRSVLILANFGVICALLFGRVLQKVFFGTLQPREVERLYDQTWMFVTESLLAFTIFRDEFDVPFLLMFGFLLFVKCFHWLMADRVESMDQTTYPGPPTLFHVRVNSLFVVLWLVDIVMFAVAVESTLTNGVGGMVLFASEYAILLASALNSMLRYTLSLFDLRRARTRGGENAPPWENKSMYIFYIELLTDFLKLATYMTFFMIILTFYGLPLNIIRDVFITARSFITRLRALVRYHNATRDMDRRYPDATEAELAEMSDRTCIICREEMQSRNPAPAQPPAEDGQPANENAQQDALPPVDGPNMTPKKLPCGHIFHFQCLRSWLERQQSCPTCRRTVLENNTPTTAGQVPRQPQGPAAPPRPGGAPAIPQAQMGGVAPNGPIGWVGRFLGLPPLQPPPLQAQFPGGPAQFPQPGAAQQQQPPAPLPNAAWGAPGQLPPHYFDPLPPPPLGVPPPPHMVPPPPPVFRGFYGPGQDWQPWGDPQWYARAAQAAQQQQQHPESRPSSDALPQAADGLPSPPAPTPTDVGRVTPFGQPRVESQRPTPTPTTSAIPSGSATSDEESSASSSAPLQPDDQPHEPRAAAALAALRRRQTGATAGSSSESSSFRPAGRATGVTASGRSATLDADMPHHAVSGSTPAASAGPSSSAPAQPSPVSNPQSTAPRDQTSGRPSSSTASTSAPVLPPLIPLYDPAYMAPPPPPAMYGAPYSPYFRGPAASRPPPPFGTYYPAPQQTPGRPGAGAGASGDASAGATRARRSAPRGPLTELPPTLTDAQLARLDRLTRDAIDERLRVLEGVSGAVYRCVEELTRLRSVLPQADTARRTARSAEGEASTSGSREAAVEGSTSSSEDGSLRSSGTEAEPAGGGETVAAAGSDAH